MDGAGDEEVVFDIRRSTRWIFDDDIEDTHLILPIMTLGIGVALLFMMTLPAIIVVVMGEVGDWMAIIVMVLLPLLPLHIGYGLFMSEGREKLYLRLTDRSILIPDQTWGLLRSQHFYKDVPLESLKEVSLEPAFSGMALAVRYTDKDGTDRTYELAYSEDGPGYEADIYGFMEALDQVHPDGPQPTTEEFMASLKGSGSGKKAPESAYMRHSPDMEWAIAFPVMYLAMFVPILFFMDIGSFSDDLVTFIMFVPTMVILHIAFTPMYLLVLFRQRQVFLDNLIRNLSIDDGVARFPTKLWARFIISRRSIIRLEEIKEVRLHLVQRPLSNLAAIEMADGTTFLVADEVFDGLEGNPMFERRGRRLVNISSPVMHARPVARINWTLIRLFITLPLLISISLAVGKLASIL